VGTRTIRMGANPGMHSKSGTTFMGDMEMTGNDPNWIQGAKIPAGGIGLGNRGTPQ